MSNVGSAVTSKGIRSISRYGPVRYWISRMGVSFDFVSIKIRRRWWMHGVRDCTEETGGTASMSLSLVFAHIQIYDKSALKVTRLFPNPLN